MQLERSHLQVECRKHIMVPTNFGWQRHRPNLCHLSSTPFPKCPMSKSSAICLQQSLLPESLIVKQAHITNDCRALGCEAELQPSPPNCSELSFGTGQFRT